MPPHKRGRVLHRQDTYKGNAWQPWTQNLYAYVGNNPVNYIDPTGHVAVQVSQWIGASGTHWDADTRTATFTSNGKSQSMSIDDLPSGYWMQDDHVWADDSTLKSYFQPSLLQKIAAGVTEATDYLDAQGAKTTVMMGMTLFTTGVVLMVEGDAKSMAAATVPKGGVYTLTDDLGNVVRTGRTKDMLQRQAQHLKDPVLGQFTFNPMYWTDVFAEQRGLEKVLYDLNPGVLYNKIRPISPFNPNLGRYMKAASDFLRRLTEQ